MTNPLTDEVIDNMAKAIADVVGHGMREKCMEQARAAAKVIESALAGD